MKRTAKVIIDNLRKNKLAFILFIAMTLLNGILFFLYNIITEAFFYAEILLFSILSFLFIVDSISEIKRAKVRENNINNIIDAGFEEVEGGGMADMDYSEMILLLEKELHRLRTNFAQSRQVDNDYYTAWVHQIKTPIAVMKLELSEDTEENRLLLSELFRIEQYVEMVLNYEKLRSGSSDLIIKEYNIDEIIRETLRKFAHQFILRKLRLSYESSCDIMVTTDKKWLSFIIEQLISNSIKYTPGGEISIKVQENMIQVSDTGIGIASEDLPRIFEKGYTGINGRLGQKSSGLGLFLTKKAANLISADIRCESRVGKGSTFTLILPDKAVNKNIIS